MNADRIKELREALKFIAGQGCQLKGGDYRCGNLSSRPCVTDYCLPCYAAAALMSDDRKMEEQAKATAEGWEE